MHTVTIETAQARLPELIDEMTDHEFLIVTRDSRPSFAIQKLSKTDCFESIQNSNRERIECTEKSVSGLIRKPGACAHMVISYIEDDDHLKDFAEYMP